MLGSKFTGFLMGENVIKNLFNHFIYGRGKDERFTNGGFSYPDWPGGLYGLFDVCCQVSLFCSLGVLDLLISEESQET